MWTTPRGTEPDGGGVHFDASGRFLVVSDDDESRSPLFAMPGGAPLERMKPPSALGPDAREMVTQPPVSWTWGGINCLIRRGEDRPILTLGEDIRPYRADRFEFSTDGKFLASGSSGDTIPNLSELSMVSSELHCHPRSPLTGREPRRRFPESRTPFGETCRCDAGRTFGLKRVRTLHWRGDSRRRPVVVVPIRSIGLRCFCGRPGRRIRSPIRGAALR